MTMTFADIYKLAGSRQAWLHIILWSLVLFLPYLVGSAANRYSIGSLPGIFFTLTGFIHIGLFYGNAFFLYPKLYTLRRWFAYLVSAVLLLGGIIFFKHYILVHWFAHEPLDANAWRLIIAPTAATFFISIVYRNIMDKSRAEKERQERKAETLAGELKFLRSQISPHFMFNVLTNLVALARKKSDQLEPSLLMLSGLMRYMLYDTRNNKISLQQEIDYLESYIALQQLRFGSEVRVESDISLAGADALTIEPMLLIPFVENAFKHGVGFVGEPWMSIQLKLQGNILHFEVKNNYTDHAAEKKDDLSGIGIENVSARLGMLYKGNYTLNITRDPEIFNIQLMLMLL